MRANQAKSRLIRLNRSSNSSLGYESAVRPRRSCSFFTAARVVAECDLLTVLPRHFLALVDAPHALVERPLPLDVPPVHVDAMWHLRQDTSNAQRWLRDAVMRAVPSRLAALAP